MVQSGKKLKIKGWFPPLCPVFFILLYSKFYKKLNLIITFHAAHRLSTIEHADTILLFQDGEIICSDRDENLLQQCETYRKFAKDSNS